MPDHPEKRVGQKVFAERDAYTAARDQFIYNFGSQEAERVVPGLLPRDMPGFTGRTHELNRLTALAKGGRVMVTAIGGTAGVGKTALAVHAAHSMLEEFRDGQLYADLRGYTEGQAPAAPGEVLEVFLRRLGVPAEEIPAGAEERSGLLRHLLASRRVLMLLDNAASEAQVRPLLPGAGGSLVLVTSRSLLPGLEANERISLDVLPAAEATTFLTGLVGSTRAEAEPEAAARVTELCGNLPLALRIAGQLLASHPGWSVARLEGMLDDEQKRLGRLKAGDLQVRAAFAVSYGHLPEEDARMFRLLGLYPGQNFDVAAAAALAGTNDDAGVDDTGQALERLVEVCLVTEDSAGRFGMHDLLRLFARETCQDTDDQRVRDAAEARLIGWYAVLAEVGDACLDPRLRPAAQREAEQAGVAFPSRRKALGTFEAERLNLVAAVSLAAERGLDELVGRLSESLGDALIRLRYLDDLLTVQEAALAAARRSQDAVVQGRALNNLGMAYQEMRRFEDAVSCYEQSIEISRKARNRQIEGWILINTGMAYQEMRRFEDAVSCYQQALAICQETGDQLSQARTLNNLGWTYHGMRRFEEAVSCCEQSLEISREAGDRDNEGMALHNLATSYQELRRFEDAVSCYQQALAICQETGDRHGEGQTLNNLGNTYGKLRRFEEAITCFEQSLAICRETGDRYSEGHILKNLGNAYLGLRRRDRAAACWQHAAAAMRDTGEHEAAVRLERLAADTGSRRRRWRRKLPARPGTY